MSTKNGSLGSLKYLEEKRQLRDKAHPISERNFLCKQTTTTSFGIGKLNHAVFTTRKNYNEGTVRKRTVLRQFRQFGLPPF